jgi:hypothetical protein
MGQAFDRTGLFSPAEPLVPVTQERLRAWEFRVGYNHIYTLRAYEDVDFDDLRVLAGYYLVAAAIETRKDQIEKFDGAILSRDPDSPRADAQRRIDQLTEFWRQPDGASWRRTALHDLWCSLMCSARCLGHDRCDDPYRANWLGEPRGKHAGNHTLGCR